MGDTLRIERSRYWHAFDKFSVVLSDGRLGIGNTLAEATKAARKRNAENVGRMA